MQDTRNRLKESMSGKFLDAKHSVLFTFRRCMRCILVDVSSSQALNSKKELEVIEALM